MQTILGAGGSIGKDLARELRKYTDDIRLVSRNPKKINEKDVLMAADLTDRKQVFEAVKGSEVAYITVGFPYSVKIWKEVWPAFMRNTLDACIEHNTNLVFFDNIYMYDKDHLSNMTEETPVNPPGEKGKVRAEIAEMLLNDVENNKVKAMIARSADFYGPGIGNSILMEGAYKPLKAGKRANWFCRLDKVHSFTYTPDAARATALLGNDDRAYGQVWHLPTADLPPTGKEWIESIANELDVKAKSLVAGKTMIQIMGWFNPLMREMGEMLYQYDRDYVFDSSKFDKSYEFKTTSYSEGIREIVLNS